MVVVVVVVVVVVEVRYGRDWVVVWLTLAVERRGKKGGPPPNVARDLRRRDRKW